MLTLTLSCEKTSEGNKSVISQEKGYSEDLPKDTININTQRTDENESELQEVTERYVAEDGTSALVTFKNTDKENTISIKSNNKTISAPQKEAWAKGAVYGNFDITIVSQNDSIKITQDKNVIVLKKARGQ